MVILSYGRHDRYGKIGSGDVHSVLYVVQGMAADACACDLAGPSRLANLPSDLLDDHAPAFLPQWMTDNKHIAAHQQQVI